jgi:hypothetical protein
VTLREHYKLFKSVPFVFIGSVRLVVRLDRMAGKFKKVIFLGRNI